MEANWEFVVLGDLKHSLEKCNLELAIIGLVMIIKTNFADGDEFLVVKKLTVCLHELLYLSLGGFCRAALAESYGNIDLRIAAQNGERYGVADFELADSDVKSVGA